MIAGQKSVFLLGRSVYVLFRIFDFLKIVFLFFFNDGIKIFGWVAVERELKYLYFLKKIIFLAITVLLLLTKTKSCFFFVKSL